MMCWKVTNFGMLKDMAFVTRSASPPVSH